MSYIRAWSRVGSVLLVSVLAVVVAACDSDSDAAVVTTQAAAAAAAAPNGLAPGALGESAAGPAEQPESPLAATPGADLSEQEIADLMLMREEEKLARDVYAVLGEQWGVQVFSNIATSEQTHMDAMLTLIDRYGLTDPVGSNAPGVFTSPDLQILYDALVEQGLTSLQEALLVGASIEDLDIADLDAAIAATDKADIASVYGNLQRGSRNHMRAFARQMERRDVDFTPSHITVAEYEAIIASGSERGNA